MGGTIYVGVNDDGTICPLNKEKRDLYESMVINWIIDEAIYPNCSQFVTISYNEDNVLAIKVEPGLEKPYYIKSKGLKPSGVYIRYGRNKSQATPEEIAHMLRESYHTPYELLTSRIQELTFTYLERKYNEAGHDFNAFKYITSGFIDPKNKLYNNIAYWFSDQYDRETKVALYQGLDRYTFKSKKEYSGSILKQIDDVLNYIEICNDIKVIIDGSPQRIEIPSYKMVAIREAVLNTYCHCAFDMHSNIKIEFFDDRLEIQSPGGMYEGLTLEEALTGTQKFRNEYVMKLLFRLGYVENYASGLLRIFKEYQRTGMTPTVTSNHNRFIVIFPNLNYHSGDVNQGFGDDGDVNGDVNSEITFLNDRDANIYKVVKLYPGLRSTQLIDLVKVTDTTITKNILSKRLRILKDYIEYLGSSRSGGYYIKNRDIKPKN